MRLLKRLLGDREPPASPRRGGAANTRDRRGPVSSTRPSGSSSDGRSRTSIARRVREAPGGQEQAFLLRVISSTEFRQAYATWKAGRSRSHDPDGEDAALRALGPDDWFVDRAYELLLGRPADPEGRGHYVAALAAGERRSSVLATLVRSEEFERRYRDLSTGVGFVPRDTQLCELANPAKWDNPEWMTRLRDLKVISPDRPLDASKGLRVHTAVRPRAAGPPS